MRGVFVRGVVPAQVVMTVGEVDVGFVKDSCPLKWRTVQSLAGCAVTELCCQWLLPTQLVLDLPTMALSFPFDREIVIFFMDTVWFSVFPLILFSIVGYTRLLLMGFLLQCHC